LLARYDPEQQKNAGTRSSKGNRRRRKDERGKRVTLWTWGLGNAQDMANGWGSEWLAAGNCTPYGNTKSLPYIGFQLISTFTGISFLIGTINKEGGSILKSESFAGIVPERWTSFPWVVR
jgi:hypothetical protein